MKRKKTESIFQNNQIGFLTDEDKNDIGVGFPKDSFIDHKGISELKYYLIVMYLRKHTEIFGRIFVSIYELMDECGYSTKSHSKKSYDDFRQIFKREIIDKEYATTNIPNLESISPNTYFQIQLQTGKSLFYTNGNYVFFTIAEFEKIASAPSGVSKSILAAVYLYIKQFITVGTTSTEYATRVAFPSIRKMQNTLGVTSKVTINNAVKILCELKLIYRRYNLYVEDLKGKNCCVPARTVFALDEKYINTDYCISQLEAYYGKKVYTATNVPTSIIYINQKNDLNKKEENKKENDKTMEANNN